MSKLQHNKVYRSTAQAITDGKKVVIHRGGTGSAKTYELTMFIIFWFASQRPNNVITVVSESLPHLKIGAIRYTDEMMIKTGLITAVKHNRSDHTYTLPNGSIIEFFSTDRIGKAIGARRDLLYGNEINNLKYEVWDELARRSEYIVADFNPTSQFWLEEWLQDYSDNVVIKSNYKDNAFLPEFEKERIEKRASRDANFRRVHIDCEYGIYEGLVFESWQQVDSLPDGDRRYGLDFGYTNDPSCLIAVTETPEAYYLDEVFYKTGLLNRDIAGLMRSGGVKENYDEVIADSAEPKSIEELRQMGFNVKPSVKGPDSVRNGIDKLKSKQIYITKRSVNLIKELRNYSWVADKDGKPTNKPIDAFNHGVDAARYAISLPEAVENWTL